MNVADLSAQPDSTILVYTANENSHDVSVVNSESMSSFCNIPISTFHVSDVALTPDGRFAYVSEWEDGPVDTVHVIATDINEVITTIAVGKTPWQLAASPNGDEVYVINQEVGGSTTTVSVIATATNTVTSTIPLPEGHGAAVPEAVEFSSSGEFAYVTKTNQGIGPGLVIIDAFADTVITGLPLPVSAQRLAVHPDPDSALVYVTVSVREDPPLPDSVAIVDTEAASVRGYIGVGNEPYGIAITPNGDSLYVANSLDATITVISTLANQEVRTINLPTERPWGVTVTPDGRFVYVCHHLDSIDLVTVIDIETGEISTIDLHSDPGGNPHTRDLASGFVPRPFACGGENCCIDPVTHDCRRIPEGTCPPDSVVQDCEECVEPTPTDPEEQPADILLVPDRFAVTVMPNPSGDLFNVAVALPSGTCQRF